MVKCKVCSNKLQESSDTIVLCAHHNGGVHMGCCTDVCSQHGAPCEHCKGIYAQQ